VLEALAGGISVVAAEAGGIPEMVRDGETGWLVPNRDPDALGVALVDALKNRETAKARAACAREEVRERFSVDTMVAGNLAVYEAVLAERKA
jgi:glycosyltransferase involved in cell wall biosynthesis